MTIEEAKKFLPLIIAFTEGKTIEFCTKGSNGNWVPTRNPLFTDNLFYRIKPEPKLIPFTFEDKDLLLNKWVREKGYNLAYQITHVTKDEVYSTAREVGSYNTFQANYKWLCDRCEFIDGTSCGKYIEE